nr:tocopherol cyclase family protein [Gloeobacter morelensis]
MKCWPITHTTHTCTCTMPLPAAVLTTPHSGYHWPGSLLSPRNRRFFEGWYYRVSLAEEGESFAFMYAIEDPAGGAPTSGGFAQVLGPEDGRTYQLFAGVEGFWATPDRLALGHRQDPPGPAGYLEPADFEAQVRRGYQATDSLNQGCIEDKTGEITRWCYRIRPVHGWGAPGRPVATMGWLSYLPVFEPGWQILMADGLAEGWIEWRGRRYTFTGAPAYGEKNWGGAFPTQWFWAQANAFEGSPGAALVAGGGRRGVLWWEESVAMVGFYWAGRFYRFTAGQEKLTCTVAPWGHWHIEALSQRHRIEVRGTVAPQGGIELLAPTANGSRFVCRDTLKGEVRVRLERRWGDRAVLFDGRTPLGGLETGGGPWDGEWRISC